MFLHQKKHAVPPVSNQGLTKVCRFRAGQTGYRGDHPGTRGRVLLRDLGPQDARTGRNRTRAKPLAGLADSWSETARPS